MYRISDALNALRVKCTSEGTPKSNKIADVLDCIATHFDCTGEKGEKGDDGADGAYVTAIALTTTEGAVTGGTATLSDGTTINITVTEGE